MLCDPDLAIARAKASQDHRAYGYGTYPPWILTWKVARPRKVPQAPAWLENSTLQSQSPEMAPQKAPQALRWLENSTLKNEGPKMGLQKVPQALRWLENSTLKSQSPKMGTQKSAAGTAMALKKYVEKSRSKTAVL